MKKRILCLLFASALVLSVFCGCNHINKKPVSLGDSVDIPDDGMISAAVFWELRDQNKTAYFQGESGDISYRWIVFGSEIKDIKDMCLGIEVTEVSREKVSFRYMSEEDFGFSPTLSIYLDSFWDAQSAVLLTDDGETQAVTITGKDKSILNFSPKKQTGECTIFPTEKNSDGESEAETVPADTEAALDTEGAAADIKEGTTPAGDKDQYVISSGGVLDIGEDKSGAHTAAEGGAEQSVTAAETQRPMTDGSGQDQFETDPAQDGKPHPAEPDTEDTNYRSSYTCTFSIECSTILNNIEYLESDKLDVLPSDGIIFKTQTVKFYEGESVYDVLLRVCRENNIHMEASWTPMYNSAYIEGIGNLYELDCGSGSGWMYRVNGWYPNYGCSRYQLRDGDTVEWRYTCDLGGDIGGGNAVGS